MSAPIAADRDASRAGRAMSFFRSRWVDPPAGVEQLDPAQLAPGFRAGAAHCGLKGGGKTDVGLLVCDAEQVSSSILLTRNASAAAPVRVCRDRVERGSVRAAVVNAGNANAETGEQGFADAWAMCDEAGAKLGLRAGARRRRRDRGDRRAAADRRRARRDRRGRGRPLGGRRRDLLRGDPDHRPLAQELHACAPAASPSRPRRRAPG